MEGQGDVLSRHAIVFYLLVALLVMAPLLGPGYYLVLDMQFGPNTFADWQFQDLYGMAPSPYGAYLPFKLAMAALSSILGVEAVQKLLLFSILAMCGISMHLSLPKEHGNARYFAGLLYMLNPFVFVRFLAGHWSFLLSYALWPFALLSFHRFLEDPKDRNAMATTAIMFTLASVSSHGVLMLLMACALLFVSHVLRKGIGAETKHLAVLCGLVLLMNLYWIVPTILLFDSIYDPAPAEAYFKDFGPASDGLAPGTALATMHGFWRGGFQYTKDVLPIWPMLFIPIALLAILGAVALLRKWALHALFFISLFMAALLLALGPASPVFWIFGILEDAIPLHMIFRDSQKFVGLVCLAYASLGSYGAHALLAERRSQLLLAGILLLPVAYNIGFFGFLDQVGPTTYPHDWSEAESIMAADEVDGNLLVLPAYLYSHYPWVESSQKTLGTPASQFFSRQVISDKAILTPNVKGDIRDPQGDYLTHLFTKRQDIKDTAELLAPLGVRYVLLLKYSDDVDNYRWLFDRRGGVKNISLVYESDNLYLFRNDFVQGVLFSSSDPGQGDFDTVLGQAGEGVNDPAVTYRKLTPASYEITESSFPYVVFPGTPSAFMRFDGDAISSWNGVGSSFRFTSPGVLCNVLFPLITALFIISWWAGLSLLSGADMKTAALLLIPGTVLFLLIGGGFLRPADIGFLVLSSLALSAFAAYVLKFPIRQGGTNFFKH